MLILLFLIWVVGNLFLAVALAAGIIPGSPPVLAAIFIPNLIIFGFFFRGYRRYSSLFKLVRDGQGELFDLAVSHLVSATRTKLLKDHYRLRRCQGLVLTGKPLEALGALDQFWRDAKPGSWDRVRARLAAVQANLALGQTYWAEQELAMARDEKRASKELDFRAIEARLKLEQGDAEGAAEMLRKELGTRVWPFVKTVKARNLFWYAEALQKLGRTDEAIATLALCIRAGDKTHYGREAALVRARLTRGANPGLARAS